MGIRLAFFSASWVMAECGCCGQTLPSDTALGSLRLSPFRARLFERVRRAGAEGIGCDDLFDWLYRDDPDGGPLSGRKVLHVNIHYLNLQLRPVGKVIRSFGAVSGPQSACGRYVLCELEYDAARDLAASIALGLKAIRERVAAGGPGWQRRS